MRPKGRTFNIDAGAILNMIYFKESVNPTMAFGWRAPKGQVIIALFLGTVPRDGSAPMNFTETMRQLGWERIKK